MRYFLIIFMLAVITGRLSFAAQPQLLEYNGFFSDSKLEEAKESVPMLEIPVIVPEPEKQEGVVPLLEPETIEPFEEKTVPAQEKQEILSIPEPVVEPEIQESVLPMAEPYQEEQPIPDLTILPERTTLKPIAPLPEQARPRNDDPVIVRGLIWGVTSEIVKNHEKADLFGEEENALFYVSKMWGLKSLIGYEFLEDRLWRIRIYNEEKYLTAQKRIDDILMIQAELEKKYGKPTLVDFKWLDTKERDHPKFWGWALFRGDLEITIQWNMPDMMVTLSAFAPEIKKPQVVVDYINKGQRTETKFDPLLR